MAEDIEIDYNNAMKIAFIVLNNLWEIFKYYRGNNLGVCFKEIKLILYIIWSLNVFVRVVIC